MFLSLHLDIEDSISKNVVHTVHTVLTQLSCLLPWKPTNRGNYGWCSESIVRESSLGTTQT